MKRTWILLLIVAAILAGTVYCVLFSTRGEYYRTYSPNGQFSVYASPYFYERHMPRMPGQAGDAAGRVYLYDELEKKVIANAPIPILWMTEGIIWEDGKAFFKDSDYPSENNPWVLPARGADSADRRINSITIMLYAGDKGISETHVFTKDSVYYEFYMATDTTENKTISKVNTPGKWASLLAKVDIHAFKELVNGSTYQMANGTDTDIIITTEKGEYIKTNAHDNEAWDNVYSEFTQQIQ